MNNTYIREQFRRLLERTCDTLGIECGLNEDEDGFDLGFIRKADHDEVIPIVQDKLVEVGAEHLRNIDENLRAGGHENDGLASRPEMAEASYVEVRAEGILKELMREEEKQPRDRSSEGDDLELGR